jgi:hypothetical protein
MNAYENHTGGLGRMIQIRFALQDVLMRSSVTKVSLLGSQLDRQPIYYALVTEELMRCPGPTCNSHKREKGHGSREGCRDHSTWANERQIPTVTCSRVGDREDLGPSPSTFNHWLR